MNCNGHSPPVKHKVDGKPHKILEKLKITSAKSTFFCKKFCEVFFVTCVHICISLNTNDITPILLTCLTLCWSYLWSTGWYLVILLLFWVVPMKKKKTRASSLFQGKVIFFENLIFNHFYESYWDFLKWYSSHKLNK